VCLVPVFVHTYFNKVVCTCVCVCVCVVQLELEGLGEFVVTVLPNAFSIKSKLLGDSLDITSGTRVCVCTCA
jgi:hypothetical protein